jgi:hypothetical protein
VTTALDPDDVTVVAAMENEARPVRRLVPQLRLVKAGIALADLHEPLNTPVVFSVGLAGGLGPELAGGTVVIPREVAREDGAMLPCDVAWSAAQRRERGWGQWRGNCHVQSHRQLDRQRSDTGDVHRR